MCTTTLPNSKAPLFQLFYVYGTVLCYASVYLCVCLCVCLCVLKFLGKFSCRLMPTRWKCPASCCWNVPFAFSFLCTPDLHVDRVRSASKSANRWKAAVSADGCNIVSFNCYLTVDIGLQCNVNVVLLPWFKSAAWQSPRRLKSCLLLTKERICW